MLVTTAFINKMFFKAAFFMGKSELSHGQRKRPKIVQFEIFLLFE